MLLRFFRPVLAGAHLPARLVACIGAAAGITITTLLCSRLPMGDLPVLVAPLGASAVLVFAVPASPLAQPWPIIGGNVLSALFGVAVFHLVPNVAVASGVAVGGAILLMSLLRCLHPPGGAAALTAVIGSQSIHAAGYGFALAPVGVNSVTLVLLGILFHRFTNHSYPHRPALAVKAASAEQAAAGFHAQDIDRALEDMQESFDIAREDLDLLLSRAELHAKRRLGDG
ncbi:HPP family protein [Sphingobium amiense]|uniref:HPP family protein n=1 Tax=Sphingobium amiense TaxID=135719 RepID=A0A494WBE9_9SPHN|nr:HPP family protein [Sphingobium amiense]BBD97862.1 HPP family protein [Sphingobium amiense]